MLPVKSVRNEFLFGIDVVENDVSIGSAAGSKNDDFSEFAQLFKEFFAIAANAYTSLK